MFLALLVYIHDLVLTGHSPSHCATFKTYLNERFKLKDLGSVKCLLGVKVTRSPQSLFLCQSKYGDILTEIGMLAAKPVSFPIR